MKHQPLFLIQVEDRYRFRRAKSFRYVDPAVEPGELYSYRVYAVTVGGYKSEASETVQLQRKLPLPDAAASRGAATYAGVAG